MLRAEQLYFEDFSSGSWPAGYSYEGNWIVSDSWAGNDTPPAAVYNWNPQQENFNHNLITDYIDVGDNDGVVVMFDFALDFFAEDQLNGLRISYDGGLGWVDVLDYFIGPGSGDVDVSRRTESFIADIEPGTDLKVRWTAYGDDSWAINGWIVDNITVLTLPKLTYVSIESSNDDSATATVGDTILLNFTADSDFENDPYVQIDGTSCTIDNLGGRTWVAYYTVTETYPDGPIEFTIDFTDMNGIEGLTAKETTDGSTVIVDNSDPPNFIVGDVNAIGGTVASNIWNSTNTAIQLEVSVPQDSAVESFNYTVGNSLLFDGSDDRVVVNGVDNSLLTTSLTIEAWIKPLSWADYEGFLSYANDDDEGETESGFGFSYYSTGWRFCIKTDNDTINYSSALEASTPANQWTHLAATYDGSQVVIYRNGSALDSAPVSGNIDWTHSPSNLEFGSYTKDGNTRYFHGYIDEVRLWNSVRSGAEIKASRGIDLNSDESGLIGYWKIDEGEGGATIDETSSGYNCTINGATWALENSPLDFKTPVYNTGVIVGSAFQLRGRVSDNDFEGFGSKDTITIEDFNSGTKLVSAVDDSFETITGFAHGDTAQLSAFLFDIAGNHSLGDTSETNTVVDIIANAPTTASIQSDNTFSHLAKTGDIVTVSMAYDEDVEVPDVTFHGNNAESETDLGGEEFQAVYTLSGGEPEGDIDFSMLVTDYLGNQNTYSGSTDGSIVVYDKTLPTLSPVNIASNNADTTWAKANDSISVTFTSNEEISADFALSFDGDDFVEVEDNNTLDIVNTITVEAWVYYRSLTRGEICVKGNNWEYGIMNGHLEPSIFTSSWNQPQDSRTLDANTWYHVAMVYDGTRIMNYIDAVGQNVQNLTGPMATSDQNVLLGRWYSGEYLDGYIDEVRVWNTARSQSEIESTMHTELNGDESGLVAYWNFNEGSGSIAYDQSNNGNDGVLNNMDPTSAWFYQRGSSPTVTIMSQDASISTINNDQFRADYITTETDPEGDVQFGISFADLAGNEGETVTSTTNNSRVIFDRTAPADFTVGSVLSTGGNVVENAWNSTNTGLNVNVPISAIDTTLKNGTVQLWAKIGSNSFTAIGSSSNITDSDLGSDKLMSLDSAEVEALPGFAEEDSIYIKAVMNDRPGNETVGTESSSRLLIDETPPSLISASYESSFSDSTLATVGHEIILTFETDVEIQTPTVTISTNTATVTDLGSNQWQATYTMQDGDEEGIIPFQIDTLTDNRGNPTEGTSSTTDGTIVTFDNTKPTLSSVKIVSNNADSSWAKVGDTVWVNFEANELLRSDSVNINILNKAATPYSIATGGWKLFFRQTVPTYLTKEQWRLWNVESPDSDNYSILNTIDDNMRGLDGKFEFKIIWPLRSGDNYNIWKQVSNPITAASGGVDGYEAVDVRFTSQYWGGLEYHTANNTLLDGSVNHGNWYYAIGSTHSWGGGIPGANDAEQLTELYVKMMKYSYFIITEANDPEGTIAFEIVVTDSVGLVSDPITSTTDNSAVIFDRTAPTLPTVHIESDNENNTLIAITEDHILLSFIPDAPLLMDSITVTISDQVATLSESGGTYTAVITMTGTEPEGILTYTIDFKDRAGNPGIQVTETTDGSYVNHDVFPPEMEAVFIRSSNTDSTWAKVDDIVSVIFTGSEVLDNINVTIAGVSATCCDTLDLMKYRGSYVMDESNEEGEITFLISYTDLGGAEGPNADTTTNNTTVRFDKTSPEFSFTRMATNNIYGDSLAGLGTVDTLAFTISENQRDLNVELAGSQKTPEQEELNFITTHTFSESDEDGWVSFALSMTDSAGNESGSLAETQDGSVVRFDGSPPTIPSIIFFSNNTNDTAVCIPGDSLYLNYTTSEVLRTVEVTIAGNLPDRIFGSDNSYTAVYGMTGAETEGFIPFNIYDIEDWVGNTGDPASETTNGSTVLFDMTPPADFTLGNVVSSGDNSGIEVPGYWNLSNQYLIVIVPIADDITLVDGGGIQLEASFGDTYNILGDTVLIEEDDLNSYKSVTVSATDFEDLDDFIEDGNATFRALMWDKAGNMTTSSESATILHIDQTTPILIDVNQKSNNTIADSLAKVGDTDTLTFTASEGLDSIVVQIFNSNALHTGNNQSWVATYVFQESDMDIDTTVFFNISFSDTAGNLVDSVNAVDTTTDGSWIRFDGILPFLDLVSFYSTNEVNPELAVVGDRLILDFISNESLFTQVVTIAGFTADTTFETGDTTRSWRTLDGTEDEGYISFEIGFADLVGNVGDTVETTTDGSSILFDMTPPADFEIDTVYVSGGTVVPGYWNATNDTVVLKIPVPENDETLIGGVYQPQVRFDSGDFTPLGDAVPIDSMDLGGFKSINITESDGFAEGANAEFTALARDKAGNETMGSSDNTIFHIDETFPSLINVNIYSDNALDTNWATVLNNISLEFMSSEGLSSPVAVMFLDTLQSSSENTGSIWIASRSINENDLEGLLPFSITFSDSAGNEGNPISESTSGSSVNIDLTSPIISDLLEGRSGEDIDYYNSSDSITLYWNHSDNISGIRDAFIALGTDSNTTDIIGWTLSGNDPLAGLGGLSLANDGIYFGGVFVRDSSGNLSDTIRGNGVYIDTERPSTGIINDGQWILEMDYTPDSTSLEYTWNEFSDNVGINYYELAVGTNDDTTNIQDWYHTDSTESMTLDGLDLERDTLYYTYLRAIDSASNKSITINTDGIYFDDSEPKVIKITPDFNDSSGVLSVLRDDTITIKFNRLIYFYDLEIHSSVDSNLITEESYADSVITLKWNTSLASNDTLTVYLDSALAYNSLFVSDTLYFYSHLWGDLNYDYDITLEDILLFNQSWPETDLGPFSDDPPHVRPAPDGDANLIDLAAFAKMWQWKYFKLSFDTTGGVARTTNGLDVKAQGKKVILKIPESTSMAEILIGESNLDIEKMTVVNPTGTAFLFQSLDTLNHLVQFSLADYRGFDSSLTLTIPETESYTFSAKIQYQFLDNKGIELGKGISFLNVDILPEKFAVFNNYPNPFNPITTIRYDLPERRNIQIKVFDVLGRIINTVDYDQVQAGRHTFTWHGKNELGKKVSTGIYFFQLTAGQDTRVQKMLLLK